jgi:hypothetical protein
MLRKAICATLIAILMIGAASAQTDKPYVPGVSGYRNSLRTDEQRIKDKEIERSYQSMIKGSQDAKKNPDPWGDVRPAQPAAAAKNKQQ